MPTARTYDFILTVADATGFVSGNNIFGVTSDTVATIANVDLAANQLKVKVDNVFVQQPLFCLVKVVQFVAIDLQTHLLLTVHPQTQSSPPKTNYLKK